MATRRFNAKYYFVRDFNGRVDIQDYQASHYWAGLQMNGTVADNTQQKVVW